MSDAHAPPNAAPDALGVTANAIDTAEFVHLRTAPTGDAIAAASVLVAGLETRSIPYHARVTTGSAESDPSTDDIIVSIGTPQSETQQQHVLPTVGSDRPASVASAALVRELGIEPNPVIALAGVVAAGVTPGESGSGPLVDAAVQHRRVVQRPGVGRATHDLADGLAHSTLFHADFSGEPPAASALLSKLALPAELDDAARTRLASRVAIAATGGEHAETAANAIGQVLRPYETPNGPLATVEGLADVLETVSTAHPGIALAYALSPEYEPLKTAALDCWRSESKAAHNAIRSAQTGRYDGLVVVRTTVDRASVLSTVARIVATTRSKEPAVLVLGTAPIDDTHYGALRITTQQSAIHAMETVGSEFDAETTGTTQRAQIAIENGTEDKLESQLIAAVREVLK